MSAPNPDPRPDKLDEELSVVLRSGENAFIVGSCHTFPGRFAVWVPSDDRTRCVSKADIGDASIASHYWIAGFLNGNVPAAPEDTALEEVWLAYRSEFLKSGEWPRPD
jgi:hypothetical protein